MAKRTSLVTFDTAHVQGEGSWIKLRPMTLGEIMNVQRQAEERRGFWHKIGAFLGRLVRKAPTTTEQARRNMVQMLQYVRAWNWVDDSGEPLSVGDPGVLDRLLLAEMQCINACVNGERQSGEQKN